VPDISGKQQDGEAKTLPRFVLDFFSGTQRLMETATAGGGTAC